MSTLSNRIIIAIMTAAISVPALAGDKHRDRGNHAGYTVEHRDSDRHQRPHGGRHARDSKEMARIERRLDRQEHRIHRAKADGELTRRETRTLRREHRYLQGLYADFSRDGRLGKREQRIMQRELDQASDHIRTLARNDHRRHDHYAWSRVDLPRYFRH